MCIYHTLYCSTRYKSVASARKKSNESSEFIEKNGVVYQKFYRPQRFAGVIKKYVLSKVIVTDYYGTDYNGYGWTNHYYRYFISSQDATTVLEMVESQEKNKKPLIEPEYKTERINNPEWVVLLKEIEEHNSMYPRKPGIMRNDFEQRIIQTPEWTPEQVCDLRDKADNASCYDELWECWIDLCKLNASAYKGYRALSNKQSRYNTLVYNNKEKLISVISEKWVKVGGILQRHDGILYITNKNGWQISFHRAPQDAMSRAKKTEHNIWSNIICSWSYKDAEEYKEAAMTWKQKQAIEDTTKREYDRYHSQSLAIRNKAVFLLLEDKKIRKYYTRKGYYSSILSRKNFCHIDWLLNKPVDYLIERFVNVKIA